VTPWQALRLAVLVVVTIAACGPKLPSPSERLSSPSANASPSPVDALQSGQLVVRQRKVDSGLYTEGAVAYLEIRDGAGIVVAEVETADYHKDLELLRTPLPAGVYSLRTYVRPCEAACPAMDAPTDECRLELTITDRDTVDVLIERRIGRCAASVVAP